MLKPARANSWTVASCSEPFGMPSFECGHGYSSLVLKQVRCAGVADVAVAQPLDLDEHRVVVAVHQQVDDLERLPEVSPFVQSVLRVRLKNVA